MGDPNLLFADAGNAKVGIGTTVPGQKLTIVGGGLHITGNIASPGTTTGVLLDYYSGGSRLWSRGADTTTRGTIALYQLESDGGNQVLLYLLTLLQMQLLQEMLRHQILLHLPLHIVQLFMEEVVVYN